MKFTGDFSKVKNWQKRLEKTAADGRRIVSLQLAEETVGLVRDGFQHARDPYGEAWEPLKVRIGVPLSDSGGMKTSWSVRRADASGYAIGSAKKYTGYHQRGTGLYGPRKQPIKPKTKKALAFKGPGGTIFARSVKGSPKRRMVPDRGQLPGNWRRRLEATAQETLAELYRK